MALTWPIWPSSTDSEAFLMSFDMPGISDIIPEIEPIFFDLLHLLEEVLEGEPPLDDGRRPLGGDVLVHRAARPAR